MYFRYSVPSIECAVDVAYHRFGVPSIHKPVDGAFSMQRPSMNRVSMVRDSPDYYWNHKYDVMEISGQEFIIFKKNGILTEVHKALGHGGRDKIMHSIKNKIHIPKKAVEMFVKMCAVCEMKRSLPKKSILLNFHDHSTKFLHLRPLKSKTTAEVAFELLKIFLEFGAPLILQSDNGKEFTAHVIEELVQLWPECKSDQDIKNVLRCWMKDNKSANWSVGCYFVQYSKNSSFHRIIGRSPYRALFGADPKTILKGTNIPDSVISSIQAQIENVEADSAEEKNPEENITNSNNQDIHTSNELTFTPLQFEIEILEDESNIEEVANNCLVFG
ncbi:hypothetical protein ABMA27_007795 [Loxostege sticticalis]|uniref:RNA-directed DNA polymerase n=1 Tax=Loxostege sticticalis TaxID=481309 RepID=A0ABR3HCW9_LOXSC